jgi:hypothetical protein
VTFSFGFVNQNELVLVRKRMKQKRLPQRPASLLVTQQGYLRDGAMWVPNKGITWMIVKCVIKELTLHCMFLVQARHHYRGTFTLLLVSKKSQSRLVEVGFTTFGRRHAVGEIIQFVCSRAAGKLFHLRHRFKDMIPKSGPLYTVDLVEMNTGDETIRTGQYTPDPGLPLQMFKLCRR